MKFCTRCDTNVTDSLEVTGMAATRAHQRGIGLCPELVGAASVRLFETERLVHQTVDWRVTEPADVDVVGTLGLIAGTTEEGVQER